MAIKQVTTTAPSQLVGIYTFSQAAQLNAAELQLVHPDNTLGWKVLGFEAISSVCATLGVKGAAVSKLNYVSDAYASRDFSHPEKAAEFIASIQSALSEAFSELSPEDDFDSQDSAATIKRAIKKASTLVDRIVDNGGALVFIHLLYLTIIENQVEDASELAMLLVHLDETSVPVAAFNESITVEQGMLDIASAAVKTSHSQMTKWEKANAAFIKKQCEYCEITDE